MLDLNFSKLRKRKNQYQALTWRRNLAPVPGGADFGEVTLASD